MRYIHANALVVDGQGVIIRGASRSGKSTLTLALIKAAQGRGREAALIGDDRVGIFVQEGALHVRGHPAIAGLIEVRGAGIEAHPHQAEAIVRLVVDLGGEQARQPLGLEGVVLPALWFARHGDQEFAIDQVLGALK